jgi:hypothetical protein
MPAIALSVVPRMLLVRTRCRTTNSESNTSSRAALPVALGAASAPVNTRYARVSVVWSGARGALASAACSYRTSSPAARESKIANGQAQLVS